MSLTYPVIAWGSPVAIASSPWADVGVSVATAGQADPFGGTGAVLLTDNDAGLSEGRTNVLAALTAPVLEWLVFAKAGSAAASAFQVHDDTASTFSIVQNINWTGGAITSITNGGGTQIGYIAVGGGWYAILVSVAWTSGHVPRLELYGASSTATSQGTTLWYLRNATLLHYPDKVNLWEEPRTGSTWGQSPAGVEDADTVGTDYRLSFDACWIPGTALADPFLSGYAGGNEYPSVNCGVAALLRAGRDKQVLTLAKDRSSLTTGLISSYLVEPMSGPPALEPNQMQRFALSFRNAAQSYGPTWP